MGVFRWCPPAAKKRPGRTRSFTNYWLIILRVGRDSENLFPIQPFPITHQFTRSFLWTHVGGHKQRRARRRRRHRTIKTAFTIRVRIIIRRHHAISAIGDATSIRAWFQYRTAAQLSSFPDEYRLAYIGETKRRRRLAVEHFANEHEN